jgi:hypothetical protein
MSTEFRGTTMRRKEHFVISRSSGRFLGRSPGKVQIITSVYLLLPKHADFKTSLSYVFYLQDALMWTSTTRGAGVGHTQHEFKIGGRMRSSQTAVFWRRKTCLIKQISSNLLKDFDRIS